MKLDFKKLLVLKGSAAAAAPKIGGEPPIPTEPPVITAV